MKVVFPWLFKFLPDSNYRAMAVWPFIFLKNHSLTKDPFIINHEKIHLKQQLECFIIPFYLIYFGEYLYYRTSNKTHDEAYRNISYEKEAYEHEKNLNYLPMRKLWKNFRKD